MTKALDHGKVYRVPIRSAIGMMSADLVAAELALFLEQGKRVDRNKALLKDILGN